MPPTTNHQPGVPAGPGWLRASFEITLADQTRLLPAKRFHTTYLEAIGGVDIHKDDETKETVVVVQNGFIQIQRFAKIGDRKVCFANSNGTTFWINVYDTRTVRSFKELSE